MIQYIVCASYFRMLGISAIILLFATASTTEARRNLITPVQKGDLPAGLAGCEEASRCVKVEVDLDAVGDAKIDIGGREFDLVTEAEGIDKEHGAITPVDVYQSPDGKNTAYAQVIVEDGHRSLHCIIRIGELATEFTLVVTNCGENCHYMLMPKQPGEEEAKHEALDRMAAERAAL